MPTTFANARGIVHNQSGGMRGGVVFPDVCKTPRPTHSHPHNPIPNPNIGQFVVHITRPDDVKTDGQMPMVKARSTPARQGTRPARSGGIIRTST
jgi:hypothetical protein